MCIESSDFGSGLVYVGTPKMFHEVPKKGGRCTPRRSLKSVSTEKFPVEFSPLVASTSVVCLWAWSIRVLACGVLVEDKAKHLHSQMKKQKQNKKKKTFQRLKHQNLI